VGKLLANLDADCPDVLSLRWRLSSLSPDPVTIDLVSFLAPPMLDICWRWAAVLSASQPWSLADTLEMRAAGQVTQPTPPFLTWAPSKSRSETFFRSPQPEEILGQQVSRFVDLVSHAVGKQKYTGPTSFVRTVELSLNLSPATIELANAAISAAASAAPANDPQSLVREIAFSTGTPVFELGPRIESALGELNLSGDID
jgi:hypothetical protein